MNTISNTSAAGRVLTMNETQGYAAEAYQSDDRAELTLPWVRTVVQNAAELLKSFAVLFALLYFAGVVAFSIAVLFFTLCR